MNKKYPEAVCFCGHDCSRCVTYLATVRNDDELRRQSQKFYKEIFNRDIPLADINCHGGRKDNAFSLCRDCPFVKCCNEKDIRSCNECGNQCEMFKTYRRKYVNKYNRILER